MFSKITKWYKALPSIAIWIMLALFYFTIGSQVSALKGLMHAIVLTSIQFTVYTINLRHLLPRYHNDQKLSSELTILS